MTALPFYVETEVALLAWGLVAALVALVWMAFRMKQAPDSGPVSAGSLADVGRDGPGRAGVEPGARDVCVREEQGLMNAKPGPGPSVLTSEARLGQIIEDALAKMTSQEADAAIDSAQAVMASKLRVACAATTTGTSATWASFRLDLPSPGKGAA